jgi:cephalosporin hydroxylase
VFGAGEGRVVWEDESALTVDGTTYVLIGNPCTEDQLLLYKRRAMLEAYEPIIEEFQGGAIVELGIYRGGSTAYFAQRFAPRSLIAFEWSPDPVVALDRFIETQALGDSVHLHYGVDQADKATVARQVEAALGDDPIDLVLDDASHRYGPTVASFEVLFPRLRPGGLYVIEDWRSEDWFIEALLMVLAEGDPAVVAAVEERVAEELDDVNGGGLAFLHYCAAVLHDDDAADHATILDWYESMRGPQTSAAGAHIAERITKALEAVRMGRGVQPTSATLGTMAAELCLGLKACHPSITEVTMNTWWIAVRRGDAELDPASFSIADLAIDPFGLLAPHDGHG